LTWPGKVKRYIKNEFTTKEEMEATREIILNTCPTVYYISIDSSTGFRC